MASARNLERYRQHAVTRNRWGIQRVCAWCAIFLSSSAQVMIMVDVACFVWYMTTSSDKQQHVSLVSFTHATTAVKVWRTEETIVQNLKTMYQSGWVREGECDCGFFFFTHYLLSNDCKSKPQICIKPLATETCAVAPPCLV